MPKARAVIGSTKLSGNSITRLHADEVFIDHALVRKLIAAQFSQWQHLPLTLLPSTGTDHLMFRLGTELLVRLPRIHWAVDGIRREELWLPRLQPHLPFAIPQVVAAGAPAFDYPYPWLVLRWIDGEPFSASSKLDHKALAVDLSDFVLALRRTPFDSGPKASRHGCLAERNAAVTTAIARIGNDIDFSAEQLLAMWEHALTIPEWHGPPVWLHADLASGNILLRNGKLHAVIDFSGVGMGDPACDLPVALNLFNAASRSVLRTALAPDDDTWARGRAWALAIACEQLPYYRESNPALAANARRTIAEVIEDYRRNG